MIAKEPYVYFSTSEDASQSNGRGKTKLEFKVPAEKLILDDIFSDNANVKIKLDNNKLLDVSEYLVTDIKKEIDSLSRHKADETFESTSRSTIPQNKENIKPSDTLSTNNDMQNKTEYSLSKKKKTEITPTKYDVEKGTYLDYNNKQQV